MDAETGQVLYGKNAEQQRHPASLTKILTAILALENLEPEQMLTASEQAVDLPGYSSSAGIEAGERLTVDQIKAQTKRPIYLRRKLPVPRRTLSL